MGAGDALSVGNCKRAKIRQSFREKNSSWLVLSIRCSPDGLVRSRKPSSGRSECTPQQYYS